MEPGRTGTPKRGRADVIDPEKKVCSKCGAPYPATPKFFSRDKTKPDGLYPSCKKCKKAYTQSPTGRSHYKKLARKHALRNKIINLQRLFDPKQSKLCRGCDKKISSYP